MTWPMCTAMLSWTKKLSTGDWTGSRRFCPEVDAPSKRSSELSIVCHGLTWHEKASCSETCHGHGMVCHVISSHDFTCHDSNGVWWNVMAWHVIACCVIVFHDLFFVLACHGGGLAWCGMSRHCNSIISAGWLYKALFMKLLCSLNWQPLCLGGGATARAASCSKHWKNSAWYKKHWNNWQSKEHCWTMNGSTSFGKTEYYWWLHVPSQHPPISMIAKVVWATGKHAMVHSRHINHCNIGTVYKTVFQCICES